MRIGIVIEEFDPARGGMELSYTLARAGHVRLTVVDVLGREVAVVFAGRASAGPHAHAVDVSRLSPGAYVVVLEAGGARHVQRLTVSR